MRTQNKHVSPRPKKEMKGIKEELLTEENVENTHKTASHNTEKCLDAPDPGCQSVPPTPKSNKEASLEAILSSVTAAGEEWPGEAYEGIVRRTGKRMPSNGWGKSWKFFCEKFNTSITLADFVRKARMGLATHTGRRCSLRRYCEGPPRKKLKPLDVMTWDWVVTNYHRRHMKELGITTSTEAYIQSRVLKMTFESISYDTRRRWTHESESIGGATEEERDAGRAGAGDGILA